jgi:N-methylhydantoinase A
VSPSITYRVGVDIGGTFTDIVLLGADGTIHTKKIPSSVDNYARAIVEGLGELFRETGLGGAAIEEIRHGTTVASNAILEHKGARVGLITTKGFRDVLEIRTLRMPRLYDLAWMKPVPLVERYLRRVVDERVDAKGRIERALDPRDAERAVDALLAARVEAIAVCLINSFANPAHELMIKAIVAQKAPELTMSVSCEVLPEIKEYERTSTTVINAYVMPIVAFYLRALRQGLDAAGIPARLMLMQSNGGLAGDAAATRRPMNIIESGPAGGVVGAQALARVKRLPKIITFDMGGTTAKAAMVEDGEISRAAEYSVGAGIMTGSRLLTGAGYTLKVPAIDLAEIGAGGGSLVWIDGGGALQIGPESAGALPGPVCYDKGGETPTVTDANVLLGYINPAHLVGGALKLHAMKARQAFADKVAAPLGMAVDQAAYGAHLIAASNMIRAIRSVSTERGRDPREFALFAFGGNGPLFACGMAQALGISRIVVPPAAGLFSSFGLLYADVEHHYARTFRRLLREADLGEIERAWNALAAQAVEQLAAEGFNGTGARLRRSAALHYQGQSYELTVPVPDGPIDPALAARLEEAFGHEHEKTYGHRAGPDEPVELVAIQLVGQGVREGSGVPDRVQLSRAAPAPPPPRPAYFGPESGGHAQGWIETPILRRSDLATRRLGPLIVEEYDATCVVPPGAAASLDAGGNIVVELG